MKKNERRMAVLGDIGSVIGFRGLGLEVHATGPEVDTHKLLRDMIRSEQYAVIFMTEAAMTEVHDLVETHRFDYMPALVPIPASTGNQGIGQDAIRVSVRKAVGFDIFANKEQKE
ncbi:MAG: V-type ATP synthase subunit F [Eubacteriales bacterium]|nr:V-type ATP synthase subunit F [Eubacteriales bacterium]